ncbi:MULTISPECIES: O-sialoglycoprotein endopeptidase [Aneurinibacillus]|jgi:N6-L-threonylcarbamoyladenine synthase|uniref:N(6)-L-threonylcarbamoyladenine synthase n=1 Tax=Aneurinibacillus danicus TaxID=267746 RepID=A0A511V4E4_9BACL|nr:MULTISPECIES: O-sialoglycoprotein endopeptidase [Aneurinibacillus]GEN32818.1 O-sialoglycoprotein endopeptidase [Aneurinibacillus danicus]
MDVVLGIDTSNYRTSLCLIDMDGQIVAEEKELLSVEAGERGLQQSTALFQHVKRLPELARRMSGEGRYIKAIAVSCSPRPVEGSYMPVFLAGQMAAEMMAHFFHVPIYYTSHQEGHIAAGEYTLPTPLAVEKFLAVHLSGGTSEVLDCTKQAGGYRIECIGGTKDLHAGQLIDRVGVALGLPFPAGPYLEELAKQAGADDFAVPSSVTQYTFSFSGPETALMRAIEQNVPAPQVARAAEKCVAATLEKVLRTAVEDGYPKDILIVGGVSANAYIRNRLLKRLTHRAVGARLYFADPAYAGDNAFGVARIGLLKHFFNNKGEHFI